MRLGQHVLWNSLTPDSKRVFGGVVRCFEHDLKGWAVIERDGFPEDWLPVSRSRLRVVQPPAKFTAKGGGDNPESSATLMAEVA